MAERIVAIADILAEQIGGVAYEQFGYILIAFDPETSVGELRTNFADAAQLREILLGMANRCVDG